MAEETDILELQARVNALEMELSQKDALLTQGFEAFTEAAERLQASHKKLQRKVDELSLELERKNRELELNLEEKEKVKTHLANIFSSLPVGVVVTDLAGRVTSLNQAGQTMLGVAEAQAEGRPVNDLFGLPVWRAGEGLPRTLEEVEQPVSFTRPTEEEPLKLHLSSAVMRNEAGEAEGVIFHVEDVTELTRLEEQALRRDRFTAMGEMAANIAHEIRNPLGSIELFSTLIKKGLDEDDEKRGLVDHISSSIVSMNHIISNLLAYTKPKQVTRKAIGLHEMLKEGAAYSTIAANHNNIEMRLNLKAEEDRILANPEQLKQVFSNLLRNAIQAMPEGGVFTISTRKVTPKEKAEPKGKGKPKEVRPPQGDGVVEVVFQDSGQGIPPEVQKRIFDPFFTTKSQGTGLGLAIVHNIVESHEGTIQVESAPGKGARFILTFPLIQRQTGG